jgi:transposase
MLNLSDQTQVYLARDPVDMRKQIDGLVLIVQEAFDLDPFDSAHFAFCNRQRDKIKVVYWHNNGFCLLYKRLEKGRFQCKRPRIDIYSSHARLTQTVSCHIQQEIPNAKHVCHT